MGECTFFTWKFFCLDVPDKFNYHWYSADREELVLSGRQKEWGRFMAWGRISVHDRNPLVVIEGWQASSHYLKIINNVSISSKHDNIAIKWNCQQNIASIYVSKDAFDWFRGKNFALLKVTSLLPGFNSIENLSHWLATKDHKIKRQYDTVQAFHEPSEANLYNTPDSLILVFIQSIAKCTMQVLECVGSEDSY